MTVLDELRLYKCTDIVLIDAYGEKNICIKCKIGE